MQTSPVVSRARWITLALLITLSLASLPAMTAAVPDTAAKVDLNRASEEDLQSLPGIGPSLAARIVDYRDKHGPFRRVEDLMNVRGIGEKSFLRIRDRLTVGESPSGNR